VEYKTAYYSFYLPVALAMQMAGIQDEQIYKQALAVLIPLGEYFQIQDDYLDCYGAPEVIGKIGTDIEDNKCSWLINQALFQASPEQRSLLEVISIPIYLYEILNIKTDFVEKLRSERF
jgi:farnesyl diphosphate synthase